MLTFQETTSREGVCVFPFRLTLEILVDRHLGLTERRGECLVVGESSEYTEATKPLAVYGSHPWCWVEHEGPAASTCSVLSSTPAGLIYSAGASLCMDNLHNSTKPLIAGRSSAYFGSWQESTSLSFQAMERVRCGRPDLLVQSWPGS